MTLRQLRSFLRPMVHHLPSPVRRRIAMFRRAHATPLHALLPLPLPESMHVDPTNACNFKCTFCPTGDFPLLAQVGRPKGVMEYDLFVKIVDDLRVMVREHGRRLTILHLYKDGEPLLNKRLPDMAAYAKKADVAEVVSTTSNGSMLSEEMAKRLIDSGIDRVRVSIIHAGGQRYQELTQTFSDYEKIRRNLQFLYEEKKRRRSPLQLVVKTNDVGLSDEELKIFKRDFEDRADVLMVDSMMGWSLSEVKDFTLGVPVQTGMDGSSPLRERDVCPEPFSRLAINFDGQVSVCCVDWSFGTIVGDLRTQSLTEIWNGERLLQFRRAHLTGNRATIAACAKCQYMKGMPTWRHLDEQKDHLLTIYREPVA